MKLALCLIFFSRKREMINYHFKHPVYHQLCVVSLRLVDITKAQGQPFPKWPKSYLKELEEYTFRDCVKTTRTIIFYHV